MSKASLTTNICGRPITINSSNLGRRFVYTPFAVLHQMSKSWAAYRRAWINLGIESELGRKEGLLRMSKSMSMYQDEKQQWHVGNTRVHLTPGYNHKRGAFADEKSKELAKKVLEKKREADKAGEIDNLIRFNTSIFDPVLCVVVYSWFASKHGYILDPFAGGSVRGIVAGVLGFDYIGVDLSERQIKANYEQVDKISKSEPHFIIPIWTHGDSCDIYNIVKGMIDDDTVDFIFSCPPYFNLERYSDDPNDLSNCSWPDFCERYTHIIKESCRLLSDNSFACFVVSDVRDEKGFYRCLPELTIKAFCDAGLGLFNKIILETAVGSLPMRINKQVMENRKIGRSFQEVLVFLKGDSKLATKKLAKFKMDGDGLAEVLNDE